MAEVDHIQPHKRDQAITLRAMPQWRNSARYRRIVPEPGLAARRRVVRAVGGRGVLIPGAFFALTVCAAFFLDARNRKQKNYQAKNPPPGGDRRITLLQGCWPKVTPKMRTDADGCGRQSVLTYATVFIGLWTARTVRTAHSY